MEQRRAEVIDQVSVLPVLFSHDRVHLARLTPRSGTPAQHPARTAKDNHGNIDKGTKNFARETQNIGKTTHLAV